MVSKSFLKFLEEHERKLEEYLSEDISEKDEDFTEEIESPFKKNVSKPKAIHKPQIKSQPIKVQPKVIKESSIAFSFCSSCGFKIPDNIVGKFCHHCGKPTIMRTNGSTVKKYNSVSEDIDYAAVLMDDDALIEQRSRLEEYMARQPKNPLTEILKANRGEVLNGMSESTSRACDLLDETPDVGPVKLLEMPDFSKFMPPKPKEEVKEVIQSLPMVAPITNVDASTQAQLQQLGLL